MFSLRNIPFVPVHLTVWQIHVESLHLSVITRKNDPEPTICIQAFVIYSARREVEIVGGLLRGFALKLNDWQSIFARCYRAINPHFIRLNRWPFDKTINADTQKSQQQKEREELPRTAT